MGFNKDTVIKFVQKLAIALFWLLVWALLSIGIHNDLVLVSPIRVLARLGELCLTTGFWLTVASSFLRIIVGFVLATAVAILLAIFSARFSFVKALLEPLILTIKSIPVASFIILVLIWVSPVNLAVIISFLMVLPIIYINVLKGIENTDGQLLEMTEVFKVGRYNRVRYIYASEVMPFFMNGASVSLGLCWKAGIAAEIIGLPNASVGEMLYKAKLYLATTDIFAWTLVIVLISLVFEKLFISAIRAGSRQLEKI